MGPAGTTLVVVKKGILGKVTRYLPTMLDYTTHIKGESMFNTPSVFAIFGCMHTLRWIDEQGLSTIEKINTAKANLLYNEIDINPNFVGTTAIEDRSKMNVTFKCATEEIEGAFEKAIKYANISGLKGHRSVGGYRASMYNALGIDSVQALVDVMQTFK
jgi:phosphoserine aminotransferase